MIICNKELNNNDNQKKQYNNFESKKVNLDKFLLRTTFNNNEMLNPTTIIFVWSSVPKYIQYPLWNKININFHDCYDFMKTMTL